MSGRSRSCEKVQYQIVLLGHGLDQSGEYLLVLWVFEDIVTHKPAKSLHGRASVFVEDTRENLAFCLIQVTFQSGHLGLIGSEFDPAVLNQFLECLTFGEAPSAVRDSDRLFGYRVPYLELRSSATRPRNVTREIDATLIHPTVVAMQPGRIILSELTVPIV